MATPPEKLAQSLEILEKLQGSNGAAAIRDDAYRARTGSASSPAAFSRG